MANVRLQSYWLLMIFLVSFGSCTIDNENKYQTENSIVSVKKISNIDSTIYFSHVFSMAYLPGKLFLAENDNERVLELSLLPEPKLVRSYGRQGQGPGEFMDLHSIMVKNNRLYALDIREISVFTLDGKWEKDIILPRIFLNPFTQVDIDTDENIYSYLGYDKVYEKPLGVVNNNGEVINEFGDYFPVQKGRHKREANIRHVSITDSNEIITVANQQGIIEKFTLDGDFICQLDLRETNPAIRKTNLLVQKKINEKYLARGRRVGGIVCSYQVQIFNGVLYYLYKAYDAMKRNSDPNIMFDVESGTYLITVDVTGKIMKELKMFSLPKTDFSAANMQVISRNEIVLFNTTTCEVEFYELNFDEN